MKADCASENEIEKVTKFLHRLSRHCFSVSQDCDDWRHKKSLFMDADLDHAKVQTVGSCDDSKISKTRSSEIEIAISEFTRKLRSCIDPDSRQSDEGYLLVEKGRNDDMRQSCWRQIQSCIVLKFGKRDVTEIVEIERCLFLFCDLPLKKKHSFRSTKYKTF